MYIMMTMIMSITIIIIITGWIGEDGKLCICYYIYIHIYIHIYIYITSVRWWLCSSLASARRRLGTMIMIKLMIIIIKILVFAILLIVVVVVKQIMTIIIMTSARITGMGRLFGRRHIGATQRDSTSGQGRSPARFAPPLGWMP